MMTRESCLLVIACVLLVVGCARFADAGYRYADPDLKDPLSVLLKLRPGSEGRCGQDIENVRMKTTYYTDDIVNVVLSDNDADRWEVPDVVLPRPQNSDYPNLKVHFSKPLFGFSVQRQNDDTDPIFEFSPKEDGSGDLVFENRYLEITTSLLGNPVIYGLGERVAPLRLPYDNQTYTIFTKDLPTPEFVNGYGAHPFYMEMRNGRAHGVLLLNSNGMDVVLNNRSLTFKVMGGVLNFFFFSGPTPKDVIRQYMHIIGTTHFPPYWSLGWQQCRYGYKTIAETADVVRKYAEAGIPLDAIWNDIDYMDGFRDFTTDPVNFPLGEVKSFVNQLHDHHQKYVMIFDPGIKVDYQYEAFLEGMRADIFIKNALGSYLLGRVWPGYVYFPDFTHPKMVQYWREQMEKFQAQIGFDGIWIDMNEVSNFCNGECQNDQQQTTGNKLHWLNMIRQTSMSWLYSFVVKPTLKFWQVALKSTWLSSGGAFRTSYRPTDAAPCFSPQNGGEAIDAHTISLSAAQFASTVYNTHNLYGHSEAVTTQKVANMMYQKRSMIITRSSFVGTGRYAGHWLGDNHSTWGDLHRSISGSITMGLFGIPFVGADICGFLGNTTSELCTRWIQLGAFYTFSRNHNDIASIAQEPYAFGPAVSKIAERVIKLKYALLPYYYTLLYESHSVGDPVLRGLFYEFPDDPDVLENDRQLLVGPHLMVIPVLDEGAVSVDGYLPSGLWYDYDTGECYDAISPRHGYRTFDAPLQKINLLLRGGGIIPMQSPGMTTYESRKNPLQLLAFLDEDQQATGNFYIDDGESLDVLEKREYSLIRFSIAKSTLLIVPEMLNYMPPDKLLLEEIKIYGVGRRVNQLTLDSHVIPNSLWEQTLDDVIDSLVISHPTNLFLPGTITFEWS